MKAKKSTNKKFSKRMSALLVVLALLTASLSSAVFAGAEEAAVNEVTADRVLNVDESLTQAMAIDKENPVLELPDGYVSEEEIRLNKSITLKVVGNATIKAVGTGSYDYAMKLITGAKLTIIGGGTLTIEGLMDQGNDFELVVDGNTTVVFDTNKLRYGMLIAGESAITVTDGSTLSFDNNGYAGLYIADNGKTTTSTINVQGTFTANGNVTDGVYLETRRQLLNVVVDGGTFSTNDNGYIGFLGRKANITVINDGVVNTNNNTYGMYFTNLIINDGVVSSNGNSGCATWCSNAYIAEGATLNIQGNGSVGLHIDQGYQISPEFTEISVDEDGTVYNFLAKAGSTVNIANNGIGVYTTMYATAYPQYDAAPSLLFEDGANVTITGNTNVGIFSLNGNYIINSAVVTENSSATNGGGLNIRKGSVVLGEHAYVYNNVAGTAGDDIYVTDAEVTVNNIGTAGLTLKSDNAGITGWFLDGLNNGEATDRWSVADDTTFISESTATVLSHNTALKAAHDVFANYTVKLEYWASVDGGDYTLEGDNTLETIYTNTKGVTVSAEDALKLQTVFGENTYVYDDSRSTTQIQLTGEEGDQLVLVFTREVVTETTTVEEFTTENPLDGETTTPEEEEFTTENPFDGPTTGDTNMTAIYVVIAMISLLGAAVIALKKKEVNE